MYSSLISSSRKNRSLVIFVTAVSRSRGLAERNTHEHATEARLRNGGRHIIGISRHVIRAISRYLLICRHGDCPVQPGRGAFRFPREFSIGAVEFDWTHVLRVRRLRNSRPRRSDRPGRIRSRMSPRYARNDRDVERKEKHKNEDGEKKTEGKDVAARSRGGVLFLAGTL